jgi:L-ascorbate metabolism protein UlaG (beta-lactamase superfamily)
VVCWKASIKIYIAGDTADNGHMKLIPMRTKLDLAILPIGDNFTMDVEDAIIASDFWIAIKFGLPLRYFRVYRNRPRGIHS